MSCSRQSVVIHTRQNVVPEELLQRAAGWGAPPQKAFRPRRKRGASTPPLHSFWGKGLARFASVKTHGELRSAPLCRGRVRSRRVLRFRMLLSWRRLNKPAT